MAQEESGIGVDEILTLAVVGTAAYLLYQLFNKGSQAATAAAAAVSKALVPYPTGTALIVLTDTGQQIPYSSVSWFYPSYLSSDFFYGNEHFMANGVEYRLTTVDPDANNLYYAAPVAQS